MPRYAQLVMGPAGSGKSTFCNAIQKHAETIRRTVHVVNLDPAAEHFEYQLLADIRDLISLDDAMEDESLRFGPNGGLVFCMEYLVQNFDWLEEQLDEIEDDYIIFDLPGQIELYTHLPVMRQLVDQLKHWNFNICGVFLIEAQFMIEPSKFVSGVMATLSTMVGLETPHISVLTKLDLLNTKAKKELDRFLEPDMNMLLAEEMEETRFGKKFNELNQAIASMIDDYSLVNFLPLDITEEESVQNILIQIDMAMQYGEDMEHREAKEYDQDDDGEAELGAMGFDNT